MPGQLSPVLIRHGDTNQEAKDDNHNLHPEVTLTANLPVYLKSATTGPGGEQRYEQHPLGTEARWGGYRVDDWLRALFHYLYLGQGGWGRRRWTARRGQGSQRDPSKGLRFPSH